MHTRTLLLLVLVALMGPAGSRAGAGEVPDGLSVSEWNSIRAEYERHRQAAFPVEGGHQARNFGQQFVFSHGMYEVGLQDNRMVFVG